MEIGLIVYPAASLQYNPFTFIIFDEEDGIAEAEFWGNNYGSTWSCGHRFKKPLFWRSFPKLPIPSCGNILKI